MLLQLAAVLATAVAGVSAVAVTYVPSGPQQQYSGQLPQLAQEDPQQQYLARQAQAGAPQQYLARQAQAGAPQQYLARQAQAGAPQQYLARPAQAGAPQQYLARQAQAGAPQQYLARPAQAGAPQQYLVRPPQGQPIAEPEDFDANPQYQFAFDVKDDQFTNYQNRKEQREGDKISGSYSVVDSDGFIRTVKYTADPREGFKAEVTREPTSIVVKIPTPPPALASGLQAGYSDQEQPQQLPASPAAPHYQQASQASRVYSSLEQPRALPRPAPRLPQFAAPAYPQAAAPRASAPQAAGDIYHAYQQ